MSQFNMPQFINDREDRIADAVRDMTNRVQTEYNKAVTDAATARQELAALKATSVVRLVDEATRLRQDIASRDSALEASRQALLARDADYARAMRNVVEQAQTIDKLQRQVSSLIEEKRASGTADYYHRQLVELQDKFRRQSNEMAEKDFSIAELRRKLDALTRESKLRTEAANLARTVETETMYAVRFDQTDEFDESPLAYVASPFDAEELIQDRMARYGFPRDSYSVNQVQIAEVK